MLGAFVACFWDTRSETCRCQKHLLGRAWCKHPTKWPEQQNTKELKKRLGFEIVGCLCCLLVECTFGNVPLSEALARASLRPLLMPFGDFAQRRELRLQTNSCPPREGTAQSAHKAGHPRERMLGRVPNSCDRSSCGEQPGVIVRSYPRGLRS